MHNFEMRGEGEEKEKMLFLSVRHYCNIGLDVMDQSRQCKVAKSQKEADEKGDGANCMRKVAGIKCECLPQPIA